MRLLNTKDLRLVEFADNDIPLYAVLSHRWGDEEVSFQDIQSANAVKKTGYKKVIMTCSIAASHGLKYAWIDTCCVDKTSSAELSEAMNSMYRLYQESAVCFAYLADVPHRASVASVAGGRHVLGERPEFFKSNWFTRGWTLQELIAPLTVIFLDGEWRDIGTKLSLCSILSGITGIPEAILAGDPPAKASIAQRMSWASLRKTTRTEDLAYCLMGLFGVNMPMLYGEGEKAFIRLQEEIIKVSDDHTIFAWTSEYGSSGGLLATSPADFSSCRDIVPSDSVNASSTLSRVISTDNKGIHLKLNFVHGENWDDIHTAILPCRRAGSWGQWIGIQLRAMSPSLECFTKVSYLPFKEFLLDDYPELKYPQKDICVQHVHQSHKRRLPILKAAKCGDERVVKFLLQKGADIESRDEFTWRTPLLEAAKYGRSAVVALLVEKRANLEAVDNQGCTPLFLAAMRGYDAVVRLLVDGGADLEVTGGSNFTPLLWAAQKGHDAVARLLVEGGANLEAMDDDGRTPLLWAALEGHEAVARMLVESNTNLEIVDSGGCTPLLWAAETGRTDIVKWLVEKGADIGAVDDDGNTPLLLAMEKGHKEIVKLLIEVGAEAIDREVRVTTMDYKGV